MAVITMVGSMPRSLASDSIDCTSGLVLICV
jgi:hypothetical protein